MNETDDFIQEIVDRSGYVGKAVAGDWLATAFDYLQGHRDLESARSAITELHELLDTSRLERILEEGMMIAHLAGKEEIQREYEKES